MVFVVIALVAFLISLGPDDTSGQGIASYFAQNDNAVEWQQFLFGVSGIFFIWFAAPERRSFADPSRATRPGLVGSRSQVPLPQWSSISSD